MRRATLMGGLAAVVLSSGCAEMGLKDYAGPIIGGPLGDIVSKSGDREFWSKKLGSVGIQNQYRENARLKYKSNQNVIFACIDTTLGTRRNFMEIGSESYNAKCFDMNSGVVKGTFDNDEEITIVGCPMLGGSHAKKDVVFDFYRFNEQEGYYKKIDTIYSYYKYRGTLYYNFVDGTIFDKGGQGGFPAPILKTKFTDKTLGKKKAALRVGNEVMCETDFKIVDENAPKTLPTKPELIRALKDLADLKQQGALTEEEYQKMREDIMKQMDTN